MLPKNMKHRTLATISNVHARPLQRPVYLEDVPADKQRTMPQFTISKVRGFLPRQDPMIRLPEQFAPVEQLLNDMTIRQRGGGIGLLGLGQFGDAVKSTLGPLDMNKHVQEAIKANDQHLLSALFRDYCFMTSAYLLEPVDRAFRATGTYSTGRDVLPACLAVPLKALADKLGHFPFMEYASSYALQNYRRVQVTDRDKMEPMSSWAIDNLRVIRAFEDADGSEMGFITCHIAMVAYTGQVVRATDDILTAIEAGDRKAFNKNMRDLLETYKGINKAMDQMWANSRPKDYLKFRSFIFGTAPGKKLNRMFPNGVVYEGVSDEPTHYRGESGANDSIVPTLDNLLQITERLPQNELTATLREFRAYRPSAQRSYLEWLEQRAKDLGVASFARQSPDSLALYILLIDQDREIRHRHWQFTKEYIIKYSDYSIATGGSKILQYLPHNLGVVLDVLDDVCSSLPHDGLERHVDEETAADVEACRKRAKAEKRILERQVDELTKKVEGKDDKRIFDVGEREHTIADMSKWTRGAIGTDGVG